MQADKCLSYNDQQEYIKHIYELGYQDGYKKASTEKDAKESKK